MLMHPVFAAQVAVFLSVGELPGALFRLNVTLSVHGPCMPSASCSSMTTSLSDPRRSWASRTWARWLSVLGRLWFFGLSFACGHDRACGQQPCLQHHGRLLSNRRNSDGPRFYIGNKGIGGFLFRTLGSHSNHPASLSWRQLDEAHAEIGPDKCRSYTCFKRFVPSRRHCIDCAARLRAFGTELIVGSKVVFSHCLRANIKPHLFGL